MVMQISLEVMKEINLAIKVKGKASVFFKKDMKNKRYYSLLTLKDGKEVKNK